MHLGWDVDNDTFFLLQTLAIAFSSIAFFLGNRLVDFFGSESRPVIALGAFISLALLVSCSSTTYSPHTFIVVFALAHGILKGFIYSSVLRAAWSHFPNHKGLAGGFTISGTGFGAFVYGMLFEKLADPENIEPIVDPSDGNLYFPSEIGKRFPRILIVVCEYYLILVILAMFLLSNHHEPEEIRYPSLVKKAKAFRSSKEEAELSLPLSVLAKDNRFLTLAGMFVSEFIFVLYFI
mmetsp:Transcript_42135/g.64619  ORF Transcript_42135/g.64619 Transcript_42135/m.64619 type:complete len:236 (+) Transcript_42135:260-967(+)